MTEATTATRTRRLPTSFTGRLFGGRLPPGRYGGPVRGGRIAQKNRYLGGHALGHELRLVAAAAGGAQPPAQRRVLDESGEATLQRRRISGLGQEAGLVLNHDFRHTAGTAAHDRLREHHGLEQDQAERLEPGWRREDVAGSVEPSKLFLVDDAVEADSIAD